MIFSGTTGLTAVGARCSRRRACKPRWDASPGCWKSAPDETTPLQKELDHVGKLLGIIVIVIAVVMIGTILLVSRTCADFRHLRCAHLRRRACGRGDAGRPAGGGDGVCWLSGYSAWRRGTPSCAISLPSRTLGSANIIASDKTRRCTKNEMTVRSGSHGERPRDLDVVPATRRRAT